MIYLAVGLSQKPGDYMRDIVSLQATTNFDSAVWSARTMRAAVGVAISKVFRIDLNEGEVFCEHICE